MDGRRRGVSSARPPSAAARSDPKGGRDGFATGVIVFSTLGGQVSGAGDRSQYQYRSFLAHRANAEIEREPQSLGECAERRLKAPPGKLVEEIICRRWCRSDDDRSNDLAARGHLRTNKTNELEAAFTPRERIGRHGKSGQAIRGCGLAARERSDDEVRANGWSIVSTGRRDMSFLIAACVQKAKFAAGIAME